MKLYYESSIVISCDDTSQNRELLRIPLLQDVFKRYPTTPINIDIKENNDELIRQVTNEFIHSFIHEFMLFLIKVSKLIQEYKREHLTYWGSFSHVICRKLTAEV